jgi:hypothetical protein
MNDKFEQDGIEEIEHDDGIEESDLDSEQETFTYSIDNNKRSGGRSYSSSNSSLLYALVGGGVLIVIIIILVIVANSAKSSSYSQVEDKMIQGAKNYYADNESLLPAEDGNFSKVDASTLSDGGYIKPLSQYFKGVQECSGFVEVYKVQEEYSYFPTLNCGSYSTQKLVDKVIGEGVVSQGSGLYFNNNEYVFRGEFPNNFVSFDGHKWRIIKVNEDKSIKMILLEREIDRVVWDDRYNSASESNTGINDFRVSRALEYLDSGYKNNKFVSKKNKELLVKRPWCIGKFTQDETIPYASLDPCNDTYDLYVGMVTVHEVLNASIDVNCVRMYDGECTNYNYFAYVPSTWTLNASTDKSYKVFSVNIGSVYVKDAAGDNYLRPVINLNPNVTVSKGTGTEKDPYVIGN